MPDLVVIKFGGSVLKDAESFRDAARYTIQRNGIAVVSAMNGVTNEFMRIYENNNFALLSSYPIDLYRGVIDNLRLELKKCALQEIQRELEPLPDYMRIGATDAFIGSPEGHSATLLKYHIISQGRNAKNFTGPEAGFVLDKFGMVDVEKSVPLLNSSMNQLGRGDIAVVGGFLGITEDGSNKRYKLGARNINDAFAATIAHALDSNAVEIIKDVPGVYRVPPEFGNYGPLERLSYNEARKMSWRGSPVVHSAAIKIAQGKHIPIVVKDMKSGGTAISTETQTTQENPVAALVAEMTCMVTVRDEIMDTPSDRGLYLTRIHQFGADNGVDIGMIATDFGGVSYTISLGDKKRVANNGSLLKDYIEKLKHQLNLYGYKPTVSGQEVGMVTVVGDLMRYKPGMLSDLAGILGKNKISIRASAQSDEEVAPPSITFVVSDDKLEASVKALAEQLFI